MKAKAFSILIGATLALITFQACEENENETKVSTYHSTESHKTGENCMNCHTGGGSGEGVFTVAGTVYDNSLTSVLPGATVRLYADSNDSGNLVATVQVDKKGNFYTTETINFGTGLYVSVEGNSTTKSMISSVTNGACNSCHGISTDRIWTE